MAKIKITGNAVILTSKLKLETIKKMEKYNSDALTIFDVVEDENIELFKIGSGVVSNINRFGITFAEANKTGEAVATVLLPANVTDKKAFVKENFANAIFYLQDLEAAVETSCAELEAAYAELDKIIVEE